MIQEIHNLDCQRCFKYIEKLMTEFEELSIQHNGANEDDPNEDTSRNQSLIIEEPKQYSRPKNTYKRRKIDTKIITTPDLDSSLIENHEEYEADSSTINYEPINFLDDEKRNTCLISVTSSLIELLNQLCAQRIPKLSEHCAFILGLDTQLYNISIDHESRAIVTQYKDYLVLGESKGKLFKNEYYVKFIIPSLINYCRDRTSIFKTMLERFMDYHTETYGFWDGLNMIEEELDFDVTEILFQQIVQKFPMADDATEHVESLIDSHHHSKYCLILLNRIIQSQISKLENPQNFMSKHGSLQKEHLIVMKQLSNFIKISSYIHNCHNTSFLFKLRTIVHPFNSIISLLYSFFTNDTTYTHNRITKQEEFIIPRLFRPEYKQTTRFIKFTSRINLETPLTIPNDIFLLPKPQIIIKKFKRSKITSGDLI